MIKSIFARPVFINPQAYLVIPLLANLSMLEPIDFTSTNIYSFESLGKVESKIISTKDEYILHIDLYESYGSCVLGEFYIGPATIGSIDDFTITTNGYITTIEVGGGDSGNIVYPGLIAAYDIEKEGKDNNHVDREWLRDLTGNGHDINLKGFAFSEMSGYGGYWANYKNWITKDDSFYIKEISDHTIHISQIVKNTTSVVFIEKTKLSNLPKYKIKVKGITGNVISFKIDYIVGSKITEIINITQDGIYEINQLNENTDFYRYHITKNTNESITCDVLIELLPEYPDALVFDGVDDYGINENMPILTDYTAIVNRRYIETEKNSCLISKAAGIGKGAFIMELIQGNSNRIYNYSFNDFGISKLYTSTGISWLNTTSYNGIRVGKGDGIDTNSIFMGALRKGDNRRFKGAFYSAYLFDRSLDEQEIKEFIRKYIDSEYLLPSEIPTPDCYYDFSLGSNDDENRETIKDQSGKGNDAKAYNIAWAGMSGYGGYDIDFKTEYNNSLNVNRVIGTLSSTKFNITSVKNTNAFLESNRLETHPSYKVKVTGVSDNLFLTYQYGTGNNFHIKTEGIHTIPAVETETQYIGFKAYPVTENCNITLELLPEYPGALVLDGTDDYIALEAFDSGFKTVFAVFKPITNMNTGFYDQIKKGEKNYYFAICGGSTDIAFSYRNTNGKTYINGKLNTSVLSKDIINKTVCIGIVNENVTPDNTISPRIGNGTHYEPWYANMVIYKFLGFKEALTEEQINAVIKKYNLLDGVDEIEVS